MAGATATATAGATSMAMATALVGGATMMYLMVVSMEATRGERRGTVEELAGRVDVENYAS